MEFNPTGSYRHQASDSVGSTSATLEASAADLVLLNQGLAKSKKISDKLGIMLTGFDERLSKLEKSLAPIHKDTSNLTRINANISLALRAVDQLLGNRDAALKQETIIRKGPKVDDISQYTAALDDIVKTSQELSRNGEDKESARQMSKLIELGSKKVVGVLTSWVRDATGNPLPDPTRYLLDGKVFPAFTQARITKFTAILTYLKALPSPANQDSELEAQKEYSDVRGNYLADSLDTSAKAAIEAVNRGQGAGSLGNYLDCLFEMTKVEYTNAAALFRGSSISVVYALLLPRTLAAFQETGQKINSIIKKSITSNAPLAFGAYEEISNRADLFDSEIRGKSGRRENELGDLLHAMRGTCLRMMPEVMEDVRSFGSRQPTPSEINSATTSDMTKTAVEFMIQLADHADTAEAFLGSLGDGNWSFGGSSGGKGARASGAADGNLLSHYLVDLLSCLFTSLEGRAKQLRLPQSTTANLNGSSVKMGVGAIFFINNIYYTGRLVSGTKSASEQLGDAGNEMVNKKLRNAKALYLEIWSPLMSALMDAGGDDKSGFGLSAVKSALPRQQAGAERREVKDRFGRFNDAFEDVETLHRAAKLSRDEADMRERLQDDVERMIVSIYGQFAQRHEGGQFSKNPSKYLKMSPEQLQERVDYLFQ